MQSTTLRSTGTTYRPIASSCWRNAMISPGGREQRCPHAIIGRLGAETMQAGDEIIIDFYSSKIYDD
jgi:hypothetical protein